MSKIEQWFKGAVGRGMNPDKAYGYQCKDVADDYCLKLFGNWVGTIRPGNAKVAFANSNADFFVKVKNNPRDPKQVPPRGAIIVWNGNMGGGLGHIAVVTSAKPNGFDVVQQDGFRNTKPAHKAHFASYAHVIGWLIPKSKKIKEDPKPKTKPVSKPKPAPAPVKPKPTPAPEPKANTPQTAPGPVTQPAAGAGSPGAAPQTKSDVMTTIETVIEVIKEQTVNISVPERLKSRKFWVAIVSAAAFALQGEFGAAAAVIMAYLGIQGFQDSKVQ